MRKNACNTVSAVALSLAVGMMGTAACGSESAATLPADLDRGFQSDCNPAHFSPDVDFESGGISAAQYGEQMKDANRAVQEDACQRAGRIAQLLVDNFGKGPAAWSNLFYADNFMGIQAKLSRESAEADFLIQGNGAPTELEGIVYTTYGTPGHQPTKISFIRRQDTKTETWTVTESLSNSIGLVYEESSSRNVFDSQDLSVEPEIHDAQGYRTAVNSALASANAKSPLFAANPN